MIDVYLNPDECPECERGIFNDAMYADVRRFFAVKGDRGQTPLRRLPALAKRIGIGAVLVKDESQRMGLGAFKGVGVAYAIDSLIRTGRAAAGVTLICATAGNHGRAVAHVARALGLRAKVFIGEETATETRLAIEAEGGEVVDVAGTYDDAVREMRRAAAVDAIIVSDTGWSGFEEIPLTIMAGYTHILDEARAQCEQLGAPPDVVIVQAGVGSFAAAVVSWFYRHYGGAPPFSICVEPLGSAPLLASARARSAVAVTRGAPTIMAGLDCLTPSSIAVPLLSRACDAFVGIDDEVVREAMRVLAQPAAGDPPVIAGPSGAASLAALIAIMRFHIATDVRRAARLDQSSTVLLINTEGATNGRLYDEIVGPTRARFDFRLSCVKGDALE